MNKNNEKNTIVYKIEIDSDDENTGLIRNSFVDFPAVEYNKLAFNTDEKIKLLFSEPSQQKFISVSLIADTPIERYDNLNEKYYVVFTKESINKIVNDFIINGNINEVSYQHTDELIEDVYLIEHFITKKGIVESPYFKDLPDGSWVTTYYVPDKDKYNKLLNDKNFNGFSVEIGAFLEKFNNDDVKTKITNIMDSDISDDDKRDKIISLINNI